MQTIAVFSAPTPGIVTINGRLAGETGPDTPLILPVTPNGTLYTCFMPYARRFRACAYRFSTSGGEFDTSAASDMCYMLLWPGGICEFSLAPPAAYPPESEFTVMDGRSVAILRGEASLLRVGQNSVALPENARLPDARTVINGAELYTGEYPGGRYAAAFSAADLLPIGQIAAGSISHENDLLHAHTELHDAAGHVLAEEYRLSQNGFDNISAVYKSTVVPASAESTAIAAAEAAILGLSDEASGYLSPGCSHDTLTAIARDYDAALPMQYSLPEKQPAIALIKKLSSRAAKAVPLYYAAAPAKSRAGWIIEEMHT